MKIIHTHTYYANFTFTFFLFVSSAWIWCVCVSVCAHWRSVIALPQRFTHSAYESYVVLLYALICAAHKLKQMKSDTLDCMPIGQPVAQLKLYSFCFTRLIILMRDDWCCYCCRYYCRRHHRHCRCNHFQWFFPLSLSKSVSICLSLTLSVDVSLIVSSSCTHRRLEIMFQSQCIP